MNVEIENARMTANTQADDSRALAQSSTGWSSLWGDVRLLLIALWLGAAVCSIVVAQGAFAVLPTRELAGAVVGFTLAFLNTSGFVVSAVLLVIGFFMKSTGTPRARTVETISLIVVALATGVGQWVIAARLRSLRAAMGRSVDELAKDDPLRVAFGSLHGYSVLVLLLAMLAAVVAFFAIARRNRSLRFEV